MVPWSPWSSRRDFSAGLIDDVLSITPMAPLSKETSAVAVSSTSMACCLVATRPMTDRTGPTTCWSKSTMWMDWVMRQPPPSSALVPRHSAES
jgi:hypothetical protein